MRHWTAYFDKVFLINLTERTDRLKEATATLSSYNIRFERFEATSDQNGSYGLYKTMMSLFKLSLEREYNKILVFEDDVKFLLPVKETTEIMGRALTQLTENWDLFYLGVNHPIPFENKISKNILRVKKGLSTHSVCYSRMGMYEMLSTPMKLPIDIMIAEKIQPMGFSYCVYPMLCSQKSGWSNIENRYVTNYHEYLEDRFAEQTKHLI